MSVQDTNISANTQMIQKKVKHFFWLNLIPLSVVMFLGYWFYIGELTLDHFPQGTEKLLWLSVLSAVLMVTLTFLTFPFSVWIRRSAKRSLKRTMPDITGERGFFSFIFGVPLLFFKLILLFLSWCFYLVVVALIGISGIAFMAFLSYAIYGSIVLKPK